MNKEAMFRYTCPICKKALSGGHFKLRSECEREFEICPNCYHAGQFPPKKLCELLCGQTHWQSGRDQC